MKKVLVDKREKFEACLNNEPGKRAFWLKVLFLTELGSF
jgi:hypothetical protein